jgi:hypothetical protein
LPVFPNRVGLILLGLLFGAALAGIAVAAAESSDQRIRMTSDLHLPDGIPMLAAIPVISNRADRRMRWVRITTALGAYSAAIVVMVAVIISSMLR